MSSTDEISPLVQYCEMNAKDREFTLEVAQNALKTQDKTDRVVYQKDIAQNIKQEFDNQKGGSWNVIVGTSFGSFVTHETKTMIYFSIGPTNFLIWKHG